MAQIFEMNYGKGKLEPCKNAELKLNQIVWLNGYGQDKHSHDRQAIYNIDTEGNYGKRYHTVNLEKLTFRIFNAYEIKPATVLINGNNTIGIYFTDGDYADPAEVERAVKDATEKQNRERAEQEAAEKEHAAKLVDGKALFEAAKPDWAKAVIVAKYVQDKSDGMTDYYATSTQEVVLLAWSKHTRDLFPEMRKACLNYKPVENLYDAPKSAEHREKWSMGSGYYLKDGNRYSTGWEIHKEDIHEYNLNMFYAAFAENRIAFPKPGNKKKSGAKAVDEVTVSRNEEKNGIEIRFPGKPADDVLHSLKDSGWRWSRFAKCWYKKYSEFDWKFAQTILTLI